MKKILLKVALILLPIFWVASSVNGAHEPYGIECELSAGNPKCCTAIGGSGSPGEVIFFWEDNGKGWFEESVTEQHYNDYHCNFMASGRPHLYYDVANWPNLDAHGAASSSCGVSL